LKILVTKIHVWDSKQNDGRERKGLNLLWIIKSCSTVWYDNKWKFYDNFWNIFGYNIRFYHKYLKDKTTLDGIVYVKNYTLLYRWNLSGAKVSFTV
jgi:hypothetical protein